MLTIGIYNIVYNNSLFQNMSSPQKAQESSGNSLTTASTGRGKIVLCNTFYLCN